MERGVSFESRHLAGLPTGPGVYMLRSARGEILYIGKAKSLRARVRSYLGHAGGAEIKTRELVRQTAAVDTLVVGSEAEALILEANLIKEHQPRFNIQLRDDKKYPYIKVTVHEPFPRAYVTRRVRQDGSRYFGPFVSVGRVRRALELVKRVHGVRSCRYNLPADAPARPCLDHHIGRCAAPCVGLQTAHDYRDMIDRVVRILSGDVASIQAEVEAQMRKASDAMDFERAALLRDVLAGLDGIARRQRVQKVGGGDQDVLGIARDGGLAAAVTMHIRDGMLIGRDTQLMTGTEGESDADLVARSVSHAYLSSGSRALEQLPREVLLPADFPDRGLLEHILGDQASRKVAVRIPQRGAKALLVELATANARHALDDGIRTGGVVATRTDDVLYDLQDRLGLKVVPRLIVCFDISHTQGTETVGSAVLFENGEPKKSGYRHMRIRGEKGNDDYGSMAETVRRYFARLAEGEGPLPDLAVVDGGRGQLAAAHEALAALGLRDVALAALAKKEEIVFLPAEREASREGDGSGGPDASGGRDGLRLPRTARSLHLLQRVRDEAHRFAVRYNRKLRTRRTVRSALGDIPGIGPARQRALLSRFGSLRGVKEATPAQIGRIPGFSEAMGARVLTYLKGPRR